MRLAPSILVVSLALSVFGGCSRNADTIVGPLPGSDAVAPRPDAGEVITVTTLDDVTDFTAAQMVASLPGPDGRVSFREAVTAANNTAGAQTIAFSIPVEEFWLMPEMGLLRLEEGPFFLNDDATTVDFSTQTTNKGDTNPNGPEIGIYGLEPNGWGIAAIYVNGDGCVIKGLGNVYQRGYAVRLVGNQNLVIACQIKGPIHAAIDIEGYTGGGPTPAGNVIGGTSPGQGNVLSSVSIRGPAEENIVIGNMVIGGGVEVKGATLYGIVARNNRIGGPSTAERNVISGAGAYGEEGFPVGSQVSVIDADGTIVEGNYVGTTVDGMRAYSPQLGPYGIEVRDSRATTIRGNLVAGVLVAGTDHYLGKVFGQAISVGATNFDNQGVVIEGNTIGLAADGVTPIPTYSGIIVSPMTTMHHAFATLIESNHIAHVEKIGIFIASQTEGAKLTRNSIHDCGTLGIDLAEGIFGNVPGVTPNDPGDGDMGANGLQNFPVLSFAARSGSGVNIKGTLDSSPSQQFVIEFFASPSCDASGFGEGSVFLGSAVTVTDGTGRASFEVTLPHMVSVGASITATATRVSTSDTSEFSACVAATAGAGPQGDKNPKIHVE